MNAALPAVIEQLSQEISAAIRIPTKQIRRDTLSQIKADLPTKAALPDGVSSDLWANKLYQTFEDQLYKLVREMVLSDGVRIDGRDTKTVRPITIDLGILPRTHGSSIFTRGETQAIVVVTLGTEAEAQRIDNIMGEGTKSFMLHYNFPPFSVGEVKPMRGPGRREIGHGALAERAVKAVLPPAKSFPYVIRIVSEITESNGSSSMATVCGSSLSLMEAGVPLRAPVAGVAMGLISDGDKFAVLTDILGDEDHLGDMDFKVCGTEKGITALQMDIKIKGLTQEVMTQALSQAKDGRLHILAKMAEAINTPNKQMSKHAPKIVTIKISQDKIRDIIGPGGKTIRSITESCDVKMEVSDDGVVSISSTDDNKIQEAIKVVKSLTDEAEVGKIYNGVVKRITDFGAFVEIIPGTDGLVHISQLSEGRVNRVTDVVQEGDMVWVKVLEVDRQGRVRLSLKDAVAERQSAGLQ
jgi:polyribonucleotide nucleotidyltransferase